MAIYLILAMVNKISTNASAKSTIRKESNSIAIKNQLSFAQNAILTILATSILSNILTQKKWVMEFRK